MNDKKVLIIAEAGVNHNGSMDVARRLIDAAASAGADIVKFQTFRAENLVCRNAQKASYQLETTDRQESQFEMLRKLELTYDMHLQLMDYCGEKQITFLSTPFDLESIRLLQSLDAPCYKIPSGEITNLPYLRCIGSCGKPVILSSGMSSMQEIKDAVAVLSASGAGEISVLHCNTQYPTPFEDVNLKAIPAMIKELGLPIGYSDHTNGIEIPCAAVALGARIIEKHFTLDRSMEGPDHRASLEPSELKAMVSAVRNVEKALGTGIKAASASETENLRIVRKSIVAGRFIKCGEKFSSDNLTAKRPGTGISPMRWDEVLGQTAKRDFKEDEMITL